VHLGYPKHGRRGEGTSNARNGTSRKKLKGTQGESDIALPRDRQASCEPQLIQKHQRRLEGFEDKILTLYARGMTTRDMQAQVQDLYGVEVSPTFISNLTEAVMDARPPMAESSARCGLPHPLCRLPGGFGA